ILQATGADTATQITQFGVRVTYSKSGVAEVTSTSDIAINPAIDTTGDSVNKRVNGNTSADLALFRSTPGGNPSGFDGKGQLLLGTFNFTVLSPTKNDTVTITAAPFTEAGFSN